MASNGPISNTNSELFSHERQEYLISTKSFLTNIRNICERLVRAINADPHLATDRAVSVKEEMKLFIYQILKELEEKKDDYEFTGDFTNILMRKLNYTLKKAENSGQLPFGVSNETNDISEDIDIELVEAMQDRLVVLGNYTDGPIPAIKTIDVVSENSEAVNKHINNFNRLLMVLFSENSNPSSERSKSIKREISGILNKLINSLRQKQINVELVYKDYLAQLNSIFVDEGVMRVRKNFNPDQVQNFIQEYNDLFLTLDNSNPKSKKN